jgi:hypothetical protein
MTQTDRMVAMSKLAGDYDKLADRAEARAEGKRPKQSKES